MSKSRVDLIFHPIRARIIVAVSGRRITANDLAEALLDIPRTTLYRHLHALTEGGILTIVEENRVRGTVERVYALDREAADLTPDEMSDMTKEDFEQLFTLFVTSLLGDFTRYLNSQAPEDLDLMADGLKFGKAQLHLTDAEFETLQKQVYGALEFVLRNEPKQGRKPRIVSITFIPSGHVSENRQDV